MEKEIYINQLCDNCVTREKGNWVAQLLTNIIGDSQTVLVLDGTDLLSMSFLDGMISNVSKDAEKYNCLVFRTTNEVTVGKLTNIAAIRSLPIKFLDTNRKIETLEPKKTQTYKVSFVGTKK